MEIPPRHSRLSRHAFTLIELLTVIAIIGILAGIMIPTVSKVRKTAARSTCASNLRQLGMGLALYAEENRGALPRAKEPDTNGLAWPTLIGNIIKVDSTKANQNNVFICSAAKSTYPNPPIRTYGINLTGDKNLAPAPAIKLASLTAPSQTAMLVEVKYDSGNGLGYNSLAESINGQYTKPRLEARHEGKANMLMADNSVRLITLDDPNLDNFLLNIRR
nr:prepilin-type N-terminal cleavage/methylation domain-containing protein [Geminisphaera colitermitum]